MENASILFSNINALLTTFLGMVTNTIDYTMKALLKQG